MKQTIRNSWAISVCAAVLCSLIAIIVGTLFGPKAWAQENTPRLAMQEVIASPGETAEVDVLISDNPGVIGATLVINYDSRLELASITNGSAFSSLDMTKPGELSSGCKVHWDAADMSEGEILDGSVMVLQFAVPADAVAGTEYAITVAPSMTNGRPDVFDRGLNAVELSSISSFVKVPADDVEHVHSYGSWRVIEQATCTSAGYREKTCIHGDDTVVETIDALGHLWGTAVVTKAASEDSPGELTWICERCGEKRVEEFVGEAGSLPALVMSDVDVVPGSQVGVDVRIMRNPGIRAATLEVSYDSSLVLSGVSNGDAFRALEMTSSGDLKPGLHLSWNAASLSDSDIADGVVVTLLFDIPDDATVGDSYAISVSAVSEDGISTVLDRASNTVSLQPASCNVVVEGGVIEHVHEFANWTTTTPATCIDSGTRMGFCTECGERALDYIPALGHLWDAGRVTAQPTMTVEGVRTFTCQRCGEVRIESIPKLTTANTGDVGLAKGKSATAGTGSSKAKYTVTGNSTVTFAATAAKNSKNIVVPDSVVINGKTYKVTKVANNAFKDAKATGITLGANVSEINTKTFSGAAKVKTVTVGKNVKKIAAKAFASNKVLRTIILKSKKLVKKSTIKNCLKGSKVTKIRVKVGVKAQNKKYVKTYKKFFAVKHPAAGKRVSVK